MLKPAMENGRKSWHMWPCSQKRDKIIVKRLCLFSVIACNMMKLVAKQAKLWLKVKEWYSARSSSTGSMAYHFAIKYN